jgi:ABC-type uncharacterized transport system permease subunit
VEIFSKLYLEPAGDNVAVRAGREKKIDEIARRALEIRKEMEKAEKQ